MTATEPISREDDAIQCVDRMRSELQKIINQCSRGDALMAAMTICFAELLRDRGGDDQPLKGAMALFAKLPSIARKETMLCHGQLKTFVAILKNEGFTLDAILWSTLGAITNILGGLGHPRHEIDEARIDMIARINQARSRSIN
jgi:hypothetical protein